MPEQIDLDRIPNLRHIDPLYLNTPLSGQPVCPTCGATTGIVYNTRYVTEPLTSWNDLWNPAYVAVLLLDDSREVIGTALQALGYSRNSTDSKSWTRPGRR